MCKPIVEEKRVLAAETFFHTRRGTRGNPQSEIKFDVPVNVSEIKILSPSMYLSTSNGGLILGATNPARFPLRFLCNNIHRPNLTSFVSLGSMDYEEERETRFTCHTNIWSDKLIVCGRFSAITVVVYGLPKDNDVETVQRRDRSCNLPVLETAGGIPEILALAHDFLDLNDDITDHEMSDMEITDRSDYGTTDRSDNEETTDADTVDERSDQDQEMTDGLESETDDGSEEEDGSEEDDGSEEEDGSETDGTDGSETDMTDRSETDITDRSDSEVISDRSQQNFTNGFSNLQLDSNHY